MSAAPLAALAAALLASPALAARRNPALEFIAGQAQKLASQGYSTSRKLIAPAGNGAWLAVYVFEDASGDDRLRVWQAQGREVHLCYLDMGSSHRIRLDRRHDRGKLPRLYGDGLPTLIYTTTTGAASSLHLVRFSGHTAIGEPTPLPEGRLEDLDGDGHVEVVSRSLPLGSLFDVDCGGFHTMAPAAYKTTIYAFRKGELVAASSRFPKFYDGDIADLEARLASLDPRATQSTGEYLDAALSLYFDHEEKGVPQLGWSRFNDLFHASPSDPAAVAGCFDQVRAELRRRLNIPDNW